MHFDKSPSLFTSRREMTFIGHCSVSPLYSKAADIAVELLRAQEKRGGGGVLTAYMEQLNELKTHTATLLHTRPENIAAVKNTSDALSMVANGYPFEPGDEVTKVSSLSERHWRHRNQSWNKSRNSQPYPKR